MKTEISFLISEEDTQDKVRRLLLVDSAYASLYEMREYLREQHRYNDSLSRDTLDFLEELREHFENILLNKGVDLDRDFS